jgi:thiaminase/transcriptional activator TenA
MAFAQELWDSVEAIRTEIERHPFFSKLADGSLPREHFRFYAIQEVLYLGNYGQAWAALASRAPRSPWILPLSQCAFYTAMLEQDFRERACQEFGLNDEEIAGTPLAPATLAYTSYQSAAAHVAPFHKAVAAVLPGHWVWWKVSTLVQQAGSPEPLYAGWIKEWPFDDFDELVEPVIEIVDDLGRDLQPRELDAMRQRFTTASRYRWMFCEMGYRRESWPV